MSFLSREGDTVPWWWPGVVRHDQERESFFTVDDTSKRLRRRLRRIREDPIPVLTGSLFVATPYVVGGVIVLVVPHPAAKVVGYSMMVPSPTDPVTFWVGYQVGEEIQGYF